MRLWHYKLIPLLPRQLLLDQHRTCCGLRGRGWGKRQRTINYVWNYPLGGLFGYHQLVISAMRGRGWNVSPGWDIPTYRGRFTGPMPEGWMNGAGGLWSPYEEHDQEYLMECIALIDKKLAMVRNGVPIYSAQDRQNWTLGIARLLK